MQPFAYNSTPTDCDVDVDLSSIKGKTVVVTGGSSGIGLAYFREFAKAGAYVINADINDHDSAQVTSEYGSTTKFVRCDVSKWSDQLAAFKEALALSPKGRIDVVIANAGISGADSVFFNDVEKEEPEEPKLNIVNINLVGVMYTTKLALHYFRRQAAKDPDNSTDQVLILQGSLAGYLGLPGAVQYNASKYGLRGMMSCLRTTEWQHNTRVNFIGPWFIATRILSEEVVKTLKASNMLFADADDSAGAALRIVTDPTITGRSFAILPREWAPRGYLDINADDPTEGLVSKLGQAVGQARYRAETAPEKQ